jgi:YgiT-type zinc finger domain-containing protein
MTMSECPVCGHGALQRETISESFEYKGQSVTIPGYPSTYVLSAMKRL